MSERPAESAAVSTDGSWRDSVPEASATDLENLLGTGVGLVLALAFLVENGLEAWSALFLERTLHSSPAVSGLGPGLFAGAMVTGRVLAQKVEWPSVAGRMLFAGLAAAAAALRC